MVPALILNADKPKNRCMVNQATDDLNFASDGRYEVIKAMKLPIR